MHSISSILSKNHLPVGLIWLFHISGIIGIFLGFTDWFLEKTPLNLGICFILLLLAWPLKSLSQVGVVYSFFAVGMFAEWCGVHYGFPFGNYTYGENLGIKLDGVPLLIGVNWAMLVLITGSIASKFVTRTWVKVLLGSFLMVFIDFFIEPNAANLGFWYWKNGFIPPSNYVGWLAISAMLHVVFQRTIKEINFQFSINLYIAQLIFFASVYVYHII